MNHVQKTLVIDDVVRHSTERDSYLADKTWLRVYLEKNIDDILMEIESGVRVSKRHGFRFFDVEDAIARLGLGGARREQTEPGD